MMMLQPQVNLLDRFVIQQESIPNFMPPLGARQPQMQFNRNGDGMTNLAKNVSETRLGFVRHFSFNKCFFFFYEIDSKYANFKNAH